MSLELKESKISNEINIIGLKIPTGGRQVSCLFTSLAEELK